MGLHPFEIPAFQGEGFSFGGSVRQSEGLHPFEILAFQGEGGLSRG
jgi:hypothetical protein